MASFIVFLSTLAVALVGLFHLYRLYVMFKRNHKLEHNHFPGALYRLDHQLVAKMPGQRESDTTIVCMPGFMEDISYFHDLYKDRPEEVIIINNYQYHSIYDESSAELHPSWFVKPKHAVGGTIEYDAMIVKQAIENLAGSRNIILHGHSRGGAVVLEALKLLNHHEYHIQAALEAPVLPQGQAIGYRQPRWLKSLHRQFLPIVFNHFRKDALKFLNSGGYKYPTTETKKKIIGKLFSNPEKFHIAVRNVDNIVEWAERTDFNIYTLIEQLTIVIPEKDSVLDLRTMKASAQSAKNINVVDVPGANHFISVEKPEVIHRVVNSLSRCGVGESGC